MSKSSPASTSFRGSGTRIPLLRISRSGRFRPACHATNASPGTRTTCSGASACRSPKAEAHAAGIPDKVLRSIDPGAGKDDRDRAARLARRNKILKDRIPTETVLEHMDSIFPGMGPDPSLKPEDWIALPLPKAGIEMLAEKLVRGVTYALDRLFIEANHIVEVHVYHDPKPIVDGLETWGVRHERGPGLEVTRASPTDYPQSGLWRFVLWGQIPIFASVLPSEMPPR